ncbi:MAG: hypothetical protein GX376_03530 [Firmicutes bacterium]|nr:hypothetical protein [Bacillota bacterium]
MAGGKILSLEEYKIRRNKQTASQKSKDLANKNGDDNLKEIAKTLDNIFGEEYLFSFYSRYSRIFF